MKSIRSELRLVFCNDTFIRKAPIHQPNNEVKCQVAQRMRKCLSFNSTPVLDGTNLPLIRFSLKMRYSPRIECTSPNKKHRIAALRVYVFMIDFGVLYLAF